MNGKENPYRDTLCQMFSLADPYLGTVADRLVPGKPGFSRYVRMDVDADLYYNVGNNAVNAAISPRGAIHRAQIFTGVCEARVARLPGVWHGFEYIDFGHDDAVTIRTGETRIALAKKGLAQDTSLIIGAFPLTRVRIGDLDVRQFVMAPRYQGKPLRALLVGLYLEAASERTVEGAVLVPEARFGRSHAGGPAGCCRYIPLDGLAVQNGEIAFSVAPDQPAFVPVLLIMAEDQAELEQSCEQASSFNSQRLIVETLDYFASKCGQFSVANMLPGIGSLYRRSIHAQLIAPFQDRQDKPVGSSWGSDSSEKDENNVWTMDTFYNYLSAGLVSPDLLLAGVRFLLLRSVPDEGAIAFWEQAGELPRGDGPIHSLGSMVAPIVLAGRYYDLTGDPLALREIAEPDPHSGELVSLRSRMEFLLNSLLATRRPDEPHLFPSRWISDGPARGKYHTGSNILAWYAFRSAARLFREVFGEADKAAEYQAFAEAMRNDLYACCTVKHGGQTMFNEGSDLPPMHDGEESGSTIAPCLGFCEPDDPALLNYKKFGCSAANPLWDPIAEGFTWEKDAITTPGFMSQLAAADSDAVLAAIMHKLCALADVDGEWWWWPMRPGSRDMLRGYRVGKCGWGTGVFLLRFVHTILGVRWDAPSRCLTVKPFVPWDNYQYAGLRVGSLELDISYRNDDLGAQVRIKHNQDLLERVTIVLQAPLYRGRTIIAKRPACSLSQGAPFYNRPTVEITFDRVTDPELWVELKWDKALPR